MYKCNQFNRHKDYLKYQMPFALIVNDPGIVLNKDGSLLTTFRYRGPDLDSAIKEKLGIMTAQLSNSFNMLGTGWAVYFEAQRVPAMQYAKDVYFPDPVTRAMDEERRKLFMNGCYFESNYYITLYWLPPSDQEGRLKNLMIEGRKNEPVHADEHLHTFINQVEKVFKTFINLNIPVEWMSPDEILTYLHSTVSSKESQIRLPSRPVMLDQVLYDVPLAGGLEPMLGNKHMRVIVPLSYLSMSQFGIFNELNRLNFSYRWVTRFFCLDKQEALSELSRFRKGWNGKIKGFTASLKEIFFGYSDSTQINEYALSQVDEVKAAERLTESDELSYGYYSTMLVVMDENKKIVEEKAKAVEQIFINMSMKAKTEDLNAVDAWMGSIPGNVYHYVRRPFLSTGNFVHMTPISDVWTGPARNRHLNGPALMYTLTTGNTPFRLDLHVGDVAHTILIGKTGSGKSVHLNMIASQFRKYKDAQVFIFDKGASSRILTEAVGGNFFDIGNEGSDLSFQPLSQVADEKERTWILEWLCDYIRSEGVTITPTNKRSILDALTAMTVLKPEDRTMRNLISSIQDKGLKNAVLPLTKDGAYGRIFDSDKDNLTFSSWQTFEMGKLMAKKNTSIISLTLMYIFHRIEQQLTGRPTIIILDECWAFFDNAVFAEKIREWLKELRKYNAAVIFATQTLDDIMEKPIFSTVLESCVSRIFLPNDKAFEKKNKAMYTAFGLNQQQIEIVASAIPKQQYYYSSPNGCRLYELALTPVELAYVAVTKADLIECQRIIDEYGKEAFRDKWKAYKHIDEEMAS